MDGSSAEAAAHRYQSLFSDVAGISSRELLEDSLLPSSTPTTSSTRSTIQPKWRFHGHNVLLVDVRTDSERHVSMISGAVSLDDFKTNILPSLESDSDSALPDMIVTYCTIGFRSGMEARNLIHEYPTIFAGWENDDNSAQEEGRTSITKVGNLDGIIPFANAQFCLVTGIFVSDLLAFPFATEKGWRIAFTLLQLKFIHGKGFWDF